MTVVHPSMKSQSEPPEITNGPQDATQAGSPFQLRDDDRHNEHIEQCIARLSLEQKLRLIQGAGFWNTSADPALGLPAMVLSDGPVGVRGVARDERIPGAVLPSPTALAATWDEVLVTRMAALLAKDAHRKGVHIVLAPTLNLHRTPFGGRNFESYSEDPLLSGRIGAAFVHGLQAGGVAATAKHYVANDSETDRFSIDVRVDERTLREVYLVPFEYAVAAGAWLVMAAYNAVNGETMTASTLLGEPLKGEWRFDGVVVSDWLAVRSVDAARHVATDLAMPGPSQAWGAPLADAVSSGRISEAAIDDKVRRLLRLAHRVGAWPPRPARRRHHAWDEGEHRQLSREAAATAMVLARNDGPLLPLAPERLGRVAVIGQHAIEPIIQGAGSASLEPTYVVSPVDGIRAALPPTAAISCHPGVDLNSELRPLPPVRLTNPATGGPGLRVRFVSEDGTEIRAEDRTTTLLHWVDDALAGVAGIEIHTRLRARQSGEHRLAVAAVGEMSLVVGEALIEAELTRDIPVDPPPEKIIELRLDGDDEVEIRLLLRVPNGHRDALIAIRLAEPTAPQRQSLAAAAAAAAEADVAVVVVGSSPGDGEGADRETLALPAGQDELVQRVVAANPRTVVVVNAGAPVELPWRESVPVILLAWLPGQEFGNALADVLFGGREPAGRLPTTWPASHQDVPVSTTNPSGGRLDYDEGLHIGYRAWVRSALRPAFPFGHGLGYSSWDYQAIQALDRVGAGEGTNIRVRIANTGEHPSREVVQVYLSHAASAMDRPAMWLAGFAVAAAAPQEEIEVNVQLPARAFQHWCTNCKRWETEPGTFTAHVGRSASDIRGRTRIVATHCGPCCEMALGDSPDR